MNPSDFLDLYCNSAGYHLFLFLDKTSALLYKFVSFFTKISCKPPQYYTPPPPSLTPLPPTAISI